MLTSLMEEHIMNVIGRSAVLLRIGEKKMAKVRMTLNARDVIVSIDAKGAVSIVRFSDRCDITAQFSSSTVSYAKVRCEKYGK